MSTERRPGFPNEEPEGKKTLEEWIEWIQREQKREYRPIRLHVTRFEKLRVAAQTNEPLRTTIAFAITLTDPEAAKKPLIANELEEEARKIHEARKQQLTPITPEEFEAQDVKGAINLMRAERSMSGKINLVEKLQPEQLHTLQQHDPAFEAVRTGLAKRPTRKEKAQRRILAIYQRRGEDRRRP